MPKGPGYNYQSPYKKTKKGASKQTSSQSPTTKDYRYKSIEMPKFMDGHKSMGSRFGGNSGGHY